MNKPLKAKQLTQAADELRVIRAALDWYEAERLVRNGHPDHAIHLARLNAKYEAREALFNACETLSRSDAL